MGSLWQLIGALLAIASLWIAALSLALLSIVQVLGNGLSPDIGAIFLTAAAFFLSGCLCLPSAYYALCRLINCTTIDSRQYIRRLKPGFLILAFPLVLAVGFLVAKEDSISWLFLPLFHILAIGIPVMLVLYIAVRGLPLGSSQRLWGVFDSGLVLGPGLILLFELGALIVFMILGAVIIAGQPQLIEQIIGFSEQFSTQSLSQEDVLEMIGPFLQRPAVVLAVTAFAALIVPMIEELFKPIGAWLLVGRRLSPAEGFAAGALSGAGYALFESLMLSGGGESWLWIILGRAGTAVLHITTSSLMGWALVQAWNQARIFRLLGMYLLAVFVHGSWNAVVIMNAYLMLSAELRTNAVSQGLSHWLERGSPVILVMLVLMMLFILLWANKKLSYHMGIKNPEIKHNNSGFDPTDQAADLEQAE